MVSAACAGDITGILLGAGMSREDSLLGHASTEGGNFVFIFSLEHNTEQCAPRQEIYITKTKGVNHWNS